MKHLSRFTFNSKKKNNLLNLHLALKPVLLCLYRSPSPLPLAFPTLHHLNTFHRPYQMLLPGATGMLHFTLSYFSNIFFLSSIFSPRLTAPPWTHLPWLSGNHFTCHPYKSLHHFSTIYTSPPHQNKLLPPIVQKNNIHT